MRGCPHSQAAPSQTDEDQQEEGDENRDGLVPEEVRMYLQSLVSCQKTLVTHLTVTACVDCIPENRDTMPCCDICKGLFFFFYLPTLPLWWTLEFLWGFVKRKRQRHRRKKRYRAAKQSQVEKEKDCYLSVDQYTRGKVEKQILGISQKNEARKAQMKGSHSHTLNRPIDPAQ